MATQQAINRPQIMFFLNFLKMHSLDFSIFCIQKNLQNTDIATLLSCNFNRQISCKCWFCTLMFFEDTLCQILVLVCRQVTLLENYCFVKFHEILTSGSLENSSSPLK